MPETAETGMPREDPGRPSRKRSRLETSPWTTHGMEDVYFQREAQVNFWTVLGGLAMAALLTQLSPLLREIQNTRWYLLLYLVTSVLVIANSWVQTSWGSLVLKWPISITATIITLFQMLSQSIQCLLVTNPSGWLVATAGIIFFALCLQFYFERSGAWQVYSPESIKRYKFINNIYILLMLICLGGAYQLYRFPSRIAEMIWGFVVLFLGIMTLYMQHKGMQMEKKNLEIP
jgi:hypothetical protein